MAMTPEELAAKMREAKARKRQERAEAEANKAAEKEQAASMARSEKERKREIKDAYNRKSDSIRDNILDFVIGNLDTVQEVYNGMREAKDYKSAGKFLTDMMNVAMARVQSVKVDDKNETQKTVNERFAKKIERIKRTGK